MNRKKPCGECPFRKKSLRGWLGNWESPEEILSQAHSEAGLPCHTSYNSDGLHPELEEKEPHICVGALQNCNMSFKIFVNPKLREIAKSVGKSDEILNSREFIQHHKP